MDKEEKAIKELKKKTCKENPDCLGCPLLTCINKIKGFFNNYGRMKGRGYK